MPQPLVGEFDLQYYPKVVLECPEHAVGIALVASEWAALEEQLILMFTYSLFENSKRVAEATYVAWSAWDAMESLKARLDFIESVASKRMDDELFKEFVEIIKPDIRKRAQERNRVVHGHWNMCKQYPDDLVLWVSGGPQMRYTAKDFHEIADRIIATSGRVSKYWDRVSASFLKPKLSQLQQP